MSQSPYQIVVAPKEAGFPKARKVTGGQIMVLAEKYLDAGLLKQCRDTDDEIACLEYFAGFKISKPMGFYYRNE